MKHLPRALAVALACLLAIVFLARVIPVATPYHISTDEEVGITEAVDDPVTGMLLGTHLHVELNVSPLHYIADKAWLAVTSSWLRHTVPMIYFRLLPLLYFSLYLVLLVLLFHQLAGVLPLPAWARLAFAGAVGLVLQTNGQLLYGVGLQDRPYALWFLLIACQMLAMERALRLGLGRPSKSVAAVGVLLSLNAFAAGAQVAVALAVRWLALPKGKRSPRLALEAAPGLTVAAWFFLHRHDQVVRGQRTYFDLWSSGLTSASLHRSDLAFDMSAGFQAYSSPGLFAAAWLIACLVLPAFTRNSLLARFYWYCLGVIAAAVPTTLVAVLVANYFEPRYLFFIYPYAIALQFLSVLAVAERLSRIRLAALFVVLAWVLSQGAYRAQNLRMDLENSARAWATLPVRAEPLSGCPEEIGGLRNPGTGRVDTRKLAELCRGT